MVTLAIFTMNIAHPGLLLGSEKSTEESSRGDGSTEKLRGSSESSVV
jgi:hypothetical protein